RDATTLTAGLLFWGFGLGFGLPVLAVLPEAEYPGPEPALLLDGRGRRHLGRLAHDGAGRRRRPARRGRRRRTGLIDARRRRRRRFAAESGGDFRQHAAGRSRPRRRPRDAAYSRRTRRR